MRELNIKLRRCGHACPFFRHISTHREVLVENQKFEVQSGFWCLHIQFDQMIVSEVFLEQNNIRDFGEYVSMMKDPFPERCPLQRVSTRAEAKGKRDLDI